MKYGLHAAVVAGLIATPIVWNSVEKTVHLVVDGKTSNVRTTADDVAAVLAAKHYPVGAHDLVAPSMTSSVHDGMRVVLRRGRLLHLDVDGRRKDVWTTARTVQAALAQLGYTSGDFVSVSRARRLPLDPTAIAIRTPRTVTVVHDHKREQVSTTDATVGQLLDDLSISVQAADRLRPASAAPLRDGQTVTLQRVLTKVVARFALVKFPTVHHNDATMTVGDTRVVTAGRNGKLRTTYRVVYLDGKVIGTTKIKSATVFGPRTQVIKDGTKPVVVKAKIVADRPSSSSTSPTSSSGGGSGGGGSNVPTAPVPSAGSAKAIARSLLPAHGWGSEAQYSCLVQMWDHESGWRVNAANPSGAYGIPQALPGSKMSSAGPDWQHDATTQIKWGLGYIADRYGSPCGAWSLWQSQGWY